VIGHTPGFILVNSRLAICGQGALLLRRRISRSHELATETAASDQMDAIERAGVIDVINAAFARATVAQSFIQETIAKGFRISGDLGLAGCADVEIAPSSGSVRGQSRSNDDREDFWKT
jgi:hypothetical protein